MPRSEMTARKSHSTQTSLSRSTPSSTAIQMPPAPSAPPARADWWSDRASIALLIALYAAQGLPMGLAFGSIPFLLKERGSSYADLASFSFASMPYSLKIFIAPVVDSIYSTSFGRRKSWIVPVQLVIGAIMAGLGGSIEKWVARGDVAVLTPVFLLLLAMAATQDIAVDGWSLTLLRKENVSFASTCQSLGLSIGYFGTFTVFLAFSNAAFCDSYVRPLVGGRGGGPLVTLGSALRLAGMYYLLLTFYITVCKAETAEVVDGKKSDDDIRLPNDTRTTEHPPGFKACNIQPKSSRSVLLNSILSTYADMLLVIKKPAVKSMVAALLIAKVGFSGYDNVAPLKLLELGFSKESMASMAVLQTPFILLGTILTGRLVAKRSPIEVYLYGYLLRFFISLSGPACVAWLASRKGVVSSTFYLITLCISILYGFAGDCLMFVGIGAFFLNVSSSSVHVAGSYLTLLNTSSNMGGLWHKAPILWLVDQLTFRENCVLPAEAPMGSLCPVKYDGYYVISFASVPVAALAGLHLLKTLPRLQKLPDSSWRAAEEAT